MGVVDSPRRPYLTISIVFAAWKAGLFALAAGSQIGPTYDTSSVLLVDPSIDQYGNSPFTVARLLTRLTSWDAIYFVKASQRGYFFEQEWAFGSALPQCISVFVQLLVTLGLFSPSTSDDYNNGTAYLEALVGVVFTTACHYLSALVLYQLSQRVLSWSDNSSSSRRWALCAALLHVLSPGGLFLSAPNAESPFSLLSFVGWLLLAMSSGSNLAAYTRDALTLVSGIVFGLATLFRTNGLLNGTPFAFEALATLYRLVEDVGHAQTPAYLRRLVVLGLSGLFVAAGSLVPQFVAYRMYCSSPEAAALRVRTPWCDKLMPSIYDYVQRTYWNTGFLKYWTLPNSPLFLLAGPMLFIMGKSSKDLFFQASHLSGQKQQHSPTTKQKTAVVDEDTSSKRTLLIQSMVASQVFLVVLAFTSYHVQIITRLSSGYPAWYWWVAACLRSPKTRKLGGGIMVYMVMYATIQGVLFASFLPPA